MRDTAVVVLIAGACAIAVGLFGLVALRLLRSRSVWVSLMAVAVVTILAQGAAVIGTAQAMFLSDHDFRVVIIVCMVAGLVALGLSVTLGRQVAAGSRALQLAARGLGEDGMFAAPADPPTAELAALSAELSATSARLAESRERERALETSRRELVAWVSHDLRTPLAGLRAMAESLEDGVATDAPRYHRQIRVEVDRLAGMVDDLFELSKIQAGALRLSLDQVSLSDLVSDTLAGAYALAQARGVQLLGSSCAPVSVRADPRELSRVLTNLVVNAIRHTPSDGTVEIQTGAGDGDVTVAVSDGCGGIPDGDLERVFDLAWRGSHARTPGPDGGAGLGLAIAKGIVEAHHGRITVANTGTGCRFEVHLPLVPA